MRSNDPRGLFDIKSEENMQFGEWVTSWAAPLSAGVEG